MPVRSLASSVLKWPSREEVEKALRTWLERHPIPGLLALGYFGSYARGEAGVGSDLDLILVVEASQRFVDHPLWQRPIGFPLEELPVPAEALVYTLEEWERLPERSPRFARALEAETRWIYGTPPRGLKNERTPSVPPPRP